MTDKCSTAEPGRWWTMWKLIERSLFAVGFSLLAMYAAVRLSNYLDYKAVLQSFEAQESRPSLVAESNHRDSMPPEPAQSDGKVNGVVASAKDRPSRSGASLAILQIPKIRLVAPLLEGTDGRTLSRGVGHIAGTAKPGEAGNIGIAGHRDSFFRGLKDIKLGDSIELKTVKGIDRYVVDQIDIVAPSDVAVLKPRTAPSLTLVTCYPFHFIGSAPQRYIVSAFLKDETGSGPGDSLPGSVSPTNSTTPEENK